MRTPGELASRFRERGLKVTPQREAVFRALHLDHSHPTAEAVHAAVTRTMPSVSLRTVYQVLNDLTAMGELASLALGPGPARFDPNVDAHHHLVCSSCGLVRDLYLDDDAVRVPVAATGGFTVDHTEVVVRGVCGTCRPSEAADR